jgi:hypothetical protein
VTVFFKVISDEQQTKPLLSGKGPRRFLRWTKRDRRMTALGANRFM